VRLCGLRLRLRLRGWRPVSPARPELPAPGEARMIADWLRGPRSRALRRAGIGLRESVLEAGSGHGVVTGELARRARGQVIALDIDPLALAGADHPDGAARVAGDCHALPFADGSFDAIFFQNVLLWVTDPPGALAEAARALRPGGVIIAIEPDYGGMMEHPELGLRELWVSGLSAAGADPLVGRQLPALCEDAGLEVWVELTHLPREAGAGAVELLDGLPMDATARERVDQARAAVADRRGNWRPFVHVPYFLVVATRN